MVAGAALGMGAAGSGGTEVKFKKATAADLAAINRAGGAVVSTYPADNGRVRIAAPDRPPSRRDRRRGK